MLTTVDKRIDFEGFQQGKQKPQDFRNNSAHDFYRDDGTELILWGIITI